MKELSDEMDDGHRPDDDLVLMDVSERFHVHNPTFDVVFLCGQRLTVVLGN